MRISGFLLGVALSVLGVAAASAQELMPMDTSGVDPVMLKSFYGSWLITDQSEAKRCNVVLKDEPTIGGSVIDVDPGCVRLFPVMGEIAAWRLMESWGIDLVDATRKTRVRFTTPDAAYIAIPEVDGIYTILQPQQ
jgi:hypothetical protein